ncbi:hypothetical protein F511_05428 [Dorcoceras hygrometricum]|uniref:Uncharacterized protein n=1 Tax=Dorcoceras hygrometricum TaxID=472368 RepID=A0A2Z7BGP9_9LAMI|nr:hypothetical protein F511_05428 [Dorcoceras hygrometricum]
MRARYSIVPLNSRPMNGRENIVIWPEIFEKFASETIRFSDQNRDVGSRIRVADPRATIYRLPRRGPRERRASGIGEHACIPASNEHLSKGAGDVSGEAPPMLKSAVYESKTRIYAVCKNERMGKAELLRAMQEAAAAPPKKLTKRKAPSMGEKEARGEKRKKAGASTSGARTEEPPKPTHAPTPPTPSSEEALDVPPVTATAGGQSSGRRLEQPPPFDPSKDSLIESPCPVAATRYICNMAPDRDVRVLRKARNADVVGHFSSHAAAVVAWGGEMVKRLTKAHQKMNASRDQFDKAMGQHAEVLARLEELETLRSREKEAAEAQRETLEAQMRVAKEAHEAEKAAREILEAELEEVKSPAPFLDVQQAIAEMPDEEEAQEEEEEGEDEDEGGVGPEATSPSSPLS